MRRSMMVLSVMVLAGFGVAFAQQQQKPAAADATPPVPADAAAKKNPVKPTPEGLAEAKRLYGYHCAMCHGAEGDGKGDLANQMKLQLHDWRDPATIANMTDGELFFIITNGRGKMVGGEGDRTKEETRWNLVNYVRAFGKKGATEAAKP